MKRPRILPPSEDDRALFRQAVADARPLRNDRIHIEPARPPAVPRQRHLDEAAALQESIGTPAPLELQLEGGDEFVFLRRGLASTVLRDLRRGRWVIQDQLDLHGATRHTARELLAGFLALCLKRQLRCVRIIHGKGLRSGPRGPVLKGKVVTWLPQWDEVLAYVTAPENNGGTGAVYVLLAR